MIPELAGHKEEEFIIGIVLFSPLGLRHGITSKRF
jgi:hypothetical protein